MQYKFTDSFKFMFIFLAQPARERERERAVTVWLCVCANTMGPWVGRPYLQRERTSAHACIDEFDLCDQKRNCTL